MGWVVNATPRPLYPQERHGTHCIGGWWASEPVWTGAEKLVPAGIRSPDRPARSELLYRPRYAGSRTSKLILKYTISLAGIDSTVLRYRTVKVPKSGYEQA